MDLSLMKLLLCVSVTVTSLSDECIKLYCPLSKTLEQIDCKPNITLKMCQSGLDFTAESEISN